MDVARARHSTRVAAYTRLLAGVFWADEAVIAAVTRAGFLHDCGKARVPRSLLGRNGSLLPKERQLVRGHSRAGEAMLLAGSAADSGLTVAARVAGAHHEHWNGEGYPRGLVGTAIPLAARIVAVADVYDALGSDRAYKSALLERDCVRVIVGFAGTQFEPLVIEAFLDRYPDVIEVKGAFA